MNHRKWIKHRQLMTACWQFAEQVQKILDCFLKIHCSARYVEENDGEDHRCAKML